MLRSAVWVSKSVDRIAEKFLKPSPAALDFGVLCRDRLRGQDRMSYGVCPYFEEACPGQLAHLVSRHYAMRLPNRCGQAGETTKLVQKANARFVSQRLQEIIQCKIQRFSCRVRLRVKRQSFPGHGELNRLRAQSALKYNSL